MTTALTIITAALEEIGVAAAGQTISAEDSATCLAALNTLADAMLTSPQYAYTNTTVTASLPAATTSLTIGVAQSLNTARPVRLEHGCFVTSGGIDYPLTVISEAQYNAIEDKDLSGSWPSVCFYDTGSPTGNVYFWPTGACTVSLLVQTQVSQWATAATDVTLPPGYQRFFQFALMEEVAGKFGRQLTPLQMRHATTSRRAIKRANFRVPQLDMGGRQVLGIPEFNQG
jgi:hypothetical protein